MSNKIEIRELLDVYEKEGLMNNSLKQREENINKYKDDIENKKSKDLDGTDEHLTYERGGDVLAKKISRHKYWLKNLYLAHKIMIHILVFIVIFILLFKLVNK
tara:strand:- start:245 stop:553 length:309 start_codon:yes stop_codon:yes gene_type:complete